MTYTINGEPFDFEGGKIEFDKDGKISNFAINGGVIIEEDLVDTEDDGDDPGEDDARGEGHGDIDKDDNVLGNNLVVPNAKLLTIPYYDRIDDYRKQALPGGIAKAPNGIESILYTIDFTKPPVAVGGNKYRSENMGGTAVKGEGLEREGVFQFSWKLLTPVGNKPSKSHIGFQLHGRPDEEGGKRIESYRNPTVGMYSDGLGNLRFYCNYDPTEAKITKGKPKTRTMASVKTQPGTWVDIDYVIKISHRMDSGWAQPFIGGKKVGKLYEGATTWNDDKICYWKLGIYFWDAVFNAAKEGRAWPRFGNKDQRLPDLIQYRIRDFALYRLPDNYKV